MKWASEMETAEIETELSVLSRTLDEFERADDEERGHGGSPGEGLYERYGELKGELAKRNSPDRHLSDDEMQSKYRLPGVMFWKT